MRKKVILITGANGEIGHGLITTFHNENTANVIGLDLHPIDKHISKYLQENIVGNILDKNLLEQLNSEYEIREIYHLAALLSTRAEFSPQMAHEVNVGGTLNLLNLAVEQSKTQGKPVKFFFPSSIAVYGMCSLENKNKSGKISENEFCTPETMYGCNKLYCENLGVYYANFYQRLADDYKPGLVDFRSIRFPGIISATTLPTGGTSDFAPEMIHFAVQSKHYDCFVREDTTIPFMTMPDAIRAILLLMKAQNKTLSRHVYNVTAFNPSAGEFHLQLKNYFSNAKVDYKPSIRRQAIVDSWPFDVNDSLAKKDWGWIPNHNFKKAFDDYLIPNIKKHYETK